MKNILVLLLILLLASCCPKIISGTSTDRKQTTIVKVTPKKHDVKVPKQEINASFEIVKCDPVTNKPIPATSTVKNGNSSTTVTISSDGTLDVSSTIDSLMVQIETRDSTIHYLNEVLTTKNNTAIVKAPIPKFYKICMWIAIGTVLMFVIKIVKIFRPTII